MKLKNKYQVVIIGSGPAGVAASIAARKEGADDVLIIERDIEPGGILLQCIHNGFGLELLKEDLPGPMYAQRFIEEAVSLGVNILVDTMVLDITPDKKISAISRWEGFLELEARSIVLAMGCRERTRSQIMIPGYRPAGVFTAGTAQRMVNVEGYMPGKRFVILGSGDIGMIMARRLTWEGAKVERVLEILSYLNGLTRNYVQCLLDYHIPLEFKHTVSRILGKNRVEAVESVEVDEKGQPIPGSEEIIPCDTLLLSVGLIPENELSRKVGVILDQRTGGPIVDEGLQTSVSGIFAAGNTVQVYDLVDWVTEAGFLAGKQASRYALLGKKKTTKVVTVKSGDNIRYVVPHRLDPEALTENEIRLQMRVVKPVEEKVWVEVIAGDNLITRKLHRYVRPGEMVIIDIPKKAYDTLLKTDSLTVRLAKQ